MWYVVEDISGMVDYFVGWVWGINNQSALRRARVIYKTRVAVSPVGRQTNDFMNQQSKQ